VRVYSENRLIGETDPNGRLLLHNLRAYEANSIRIEPKDLPVTADVETVKNVVAPRFRSGVTVDFPVDDSRPVLLSIHRPDGSPVPSGATVSLRDGAQTFLVGFDGEVMLRAVKFGELVSVEHADGSCAFAIDREIPNTPVARLGQFICEAP
jgi:outer membrane usher protein